MIRLVVVAAFVGTTLSVASAPAQASCREVEVVSVVQGAFRTEVIQVCGGTSGGGSAAPADTGPITQAGVVACALRAAVAGIALDEYCPVTEPTVAAAPDIPSLVSRAFQRLPLPPSQLNVQPPNGRTLVNFDTNFFTERPAFTRVVTLLGQRITLRIEPTSFTWHFGTGDARTTGTPGAPYPRLLVTHDYERKGTFRPRVDTTYSATFRVGGGPWRPVPGSVTITGPTVALQAVEARPVLTAP